MRLPTKEARGIRIKHPASQPITSPTFHRTPGMGHYFGLRGHIEFEKRNTPTRPAPRDSFFSGVSIRTNSTHPLSGRCIDSAGREKNNISIENETIKKIKQLYFGAGELLRITWRKRRRSGGGRAAIDSCRRPTALLWPQ